MIENMPEHMHMLEHGHDWLPGLLPMMLGIAFWSVLLTILAWALIRWLSTRTMFGEWYTPTSNIPPEQPSAIEILRQRYARGEIDAVTFEQMRERLEASYWQSYQQHTYEGMQARERSDGPKYT